MVSKKLNNTAKHKIKPLLIEPLYKTHNTLFSKSFRFLRLFLLSSSVLLMVSLPLVVVYGYKLAYTKLVGLLAIALIIVGVIKLLEHLIKWISRGDS